MEDTRDILNKIRRINEQQESISSIRRGLLKEAGEQQQNAANQQVTNKQKQKLDAIAITNDPKFGNNALQAQIDQFRASVESGAQFTDPKDGKVSESPLIYMPSTGNLIFSGVIPCLNNLKFQYVLKTTTGNGCFVWSDGMILNKENLQLLNKLYGNYMGWRDSWNAESADFDKMVKNMLANQE